MQGRAGQCGCREGKAGQDGKAGHGRARQGRAGRQGRARQGRAGQGRASHGGAKRGRRPCPSGENWTRLRLLLQIIILAVGIVVLGVIDDRR